MIETIEDLADDIGALEDELEILRVSGVRNSDAGYQLIQDTLISKQLNYRKQTGNYLKVEKINCAIYNERPEVCRLYGTIDKLPCPHFRKSGNPRSHASKVLTQKQINRDVDKAMGKLGVKNG